MYHYTECGLDNVWLANGFTKKQTAYGEAVAIAHADSLDRLGIAAHVFVDTFAHQGFIGQRIQRDNPARSSSDLFSAFDDEDGDVRYKKFHDAASDQRYDVLKKFCPPLAFTQLESKPLPVFFSKNFRKSIE